MILVSCIFSVYYMVYKVVISIFNLPCDIVYKALYKDVKIAQMYAQGVLYKDRSCKSCCPNICNGNKIKLLKNVTQINEEKLSLCFQWIHFGGFYEHPGDQTYKHFLSPFL